MEDTIYVSEKIVSCRGAPSDNAMGHPSIYLNLGVESTVQCPYCSKKFVYISSTQKKEEVS